MIRGKPTEARVQRTLFASVLAALSLAAFAQSGGPRTLAELKADVQERADRRVYPVSQLEPAEVREALGALKTLDRDEWAAAWSAIGDRHMALAKKAAPDPAQASKHYKYAFEYRSEEHTSELQSRLHLVCRLLLEKKKQQ